MEWPTAIYGASIHILGSNRDEWRGEVFKVLNWGDESCASIAAYRRGWKWLASKTCRVENTLPRWQSCQWALAIFTVEHRQAALGSQKCHTSISFHCHQDSIAVLVSYDRRQVYRLISLDHRHPGASLVPSHPGSPERSPRPTLS